MKCFYCDLCITQPSCELKLTLSLHPQESVKSGVRTWAHVVHRTVPTLISFKIHIIWLDITYFHQQSCDLSLQCQLTSCHTTSSTPIHTHAHTHAHTHCCQCYKTSGSLHLPCSPTTHHAIAGMCMFILYMCVCVCVCVCVLGGLGEVQESILFFHLPCSVTFVAAAEHVQDNFSILPAVDSCGVNYTKAAAFGGLGWYRVCVCVCLLGHVNPVQSEVLQVLDQDLVSLVSLALYFHLLTKLMR